MTFTLLNHMHTHSRHNPLLHTKLPSPALISTTKTQFSLSLCLQLEKQRRREGRHHYTSPSIRGPIFKFEMKLSEREARPPFGVGSSFQSQLKELSVSCAAVECGVRAWFLVVVVVVVNSNHLSLYLFAASTPSARFANSIRPY